MEQRAPRIHLTGAISLTNKGTAAIVISLIDSLRQVLPTADISIELVYPEKQKSLFDLKEKSGVRVVSPAFEKPAKAILLFLLAMLLAPLRRVVPKAFPFMNWFQPYAAADIVIDISAEAFITYFDDDFAQQAVRFGSHLYPLLLSWLLSKPTAILAQTLAPFGVFRPLMKLVIYSAKIVTVRDPISLKNLEKDGVDISRVQLTADPAFLLKHIIPPSTPQKLGKGPVIGVLAARQTGRTLSPQQYENLLDTFAKTIQRLIDESDATVVFIPHSSGKLRSVSDDVQVGLAIQERLGVGDRFSVVKEDWSPLLLKGYIGACDVILSLRMHPVIAALTMKVPCVLIGFNDKALGLMQRMGLERYTCRIDNLQVDWLVDSVKSCYQERERIQSHLNEVIQPIQALAAQNSRLIAEFWQSQP